VSTRGVSSRWLRIAWPHEARRQVGARHIARARGAFRGGDVCPSRKVEPFPSPAPDGATQASWARRARKGLPPLSPVAAATIQGPVFEGGPRVKYCGVCVVRTAYAGCHSGLSTPDRTPVGPRAPAPRPQLADAFGRAGRPSSRQYPGVRLDESDFGGRRRRRHRRAWPTRRFSFRSCGWECL